ncbi:MAG: hypothetical protein ACE5JS_12655 [Nitrospinota bacterium]
MARVDLLVTPEAGGTPFKAEGISVTLAEQKGAELFIREMEAAGPLKDIRFAFRWLPAFLPRPSPPPGYETLSGRTVHPDGETSPPERVAIPRPSSSPDPSEKADPELATAGQYVSANLADRTALALRPQRLPTLSCGPGVPGKEVISLIGLASGAARKALLILSREGERELTLVSDGTAYGRRGRQAVGRIADELGLRVRSVVVPSGDWKELRGVFRTGGSLPVLAWLDRQGAERIVRAAREAAYAAPLLLGPAAVHPLLAAAPQLRLSEEEMKPPRGEPDEVILAIGHKLAVAGALPSEDPLKEKLERFRYVYELAYRAPPPLPSVCAYDALLFLSESLLQAADPKSTQSLVARALSRMPERDTFEGTLGTYHFSGAGGWLNREGRLGEESFVLLRAQKEKWTPVNGPGERLTGFKDKSFTATRALSPLLTVRDESVPQGEATVPVSIRR